ncbi:class I SAM-dependent methyltransferase [Acaryochloris sp. IP29b_bin.137]|uniref:class I SAM-dependent methyltransferase n=1 Tax=Acaryochloris sp. IP29b_bin.137 TaxID=2969217 RepID=UPI00261FB78E|nr:class I SAM-dependent methyltransferase [Acaryochloris sp. IP29b_bin.137]
MTNPGSEASVLLTRVPEPELMDDDGQAQAYAEANFEEPHNHFVQLLQETFPELPKTGKALDLGCGPGDITLRFARAFPAWSVEGWDASEAMLNYGYQAVAAAELQDRITLKKIYVPQRDTASDTKRDTVSFPLIFSNSLLHHLADPMALWTEVKQQSGPGTWVFIMDLMRPATRETARDFVDLYAQGEPEVLRRDFFNSLLAAYRVNEVEDQLVKAGLAELQVRAVSDRHLIIWGHI